MSPFAASSDRPPTQTAPLAFGLAARLFCFVAYFLRRGALVRFIVRFVALRVVGLDFAMVASLIAAGAAAESALP